jgi:hypothetical protein
MVLPRAQLRVEVSMPCVAPPGYAVASGHELQSDLSQYVAGDWFVGLLGRWGRDSHQALPA